MAHDELLVDCAQCTPGGLYLSDESFTVECFSFFKVALEGLNLSLSAAQAINECFGRFSIHKLYSSPLHVLSLPTRGGENVVQYDAVS